MNVFLLGLAFMFVFTGFNTMSGIQTLIFNSATHEDSGGFVPGFQVGIFLKMLVTISNMKSHRATVLSPQQ